LNAELKIVGTEDATEETTELVADLEKKL